MDQLHTQYAATLRAEGLPSEAREQSRLLDACIEAGMDYMNPDHVAWATNAVTNDLLRAAA